MIKWFCHHWFLEDVISTRLKVDILPIPRLLFAQHPLEKELNSLMKIFAGVAILLARHWSRCANRLCKVLMERLLPGSPVLFLEHIFELRKGVDPGEFTLFCPFIKFGDRFIDCEFYRVAAVILMDFNSTFVLGIVALQLVDFRQVVIVIPFLFSLIERGTLVDGSHCVCLIALCIQVSFKTFFVMLHVQFA